MRTWRGFAETGDRLDYHHLTCSEHIALPAHELGRRGARYWDPLATFGYLAARTERIRFATHVLVLPYHHPLEIAKRYGTLDVVSGGRVILGVGVGTLKEEFDLLGARTTTEAHAPTMPCGRSTRVALDARAGLSRYLLLLRGPRRRSLRRTGPRPHLGGGANAPLAAQGGRALGRLVPLRGGAGSSRPMAGTDRASAGFEVVLPPTARLDPVKEPNEAVDILAATAEAGATIVSVGPTFDSLGEYLDYLEALAGLHAGMGA